MRATTDVFPGLDGTKEVNSASFFVGQAPAYATTLRAAQCSIARLCVVGAPLVDEEMKALDKLDTKEVVLINQYEFGSWRKDNPNRMFQKDSLASIKLDLYKPNHLKYTSNNTNDGFAVFSEIYYEHGWKATIDGNDSDILRVDYTLRGMHIPKGKHTIEFKFEPAVYEQGEKMALAGSMLLLVLIGAAVFMEFKGKSKDAKS